MDRVKFFDGVRGAPFGGSLTGPQVSGMEILLDLCPPLFPLDHLAYALATTFHETARTMRPIEEYGRGKGKAYGSTGFWGRGYVQLTWEANYIRATRRLRQLGYLQADEDLTKTPALAMDPHVAAPILFTGMTEGWFTDKKLADYFGPGKSDPIGARRIINGTDKAAQISVYHAAFRAALVLAGYQAGAVAPVPVPPVVVAPLPPVAPAAPVVGPGSGFWASVLSRLRAAYPPKV